MFTQRTIECNAVVNQRIKLSASDKTGWHFLTKIVIENTVVRGFFIIIAG